MQILPLFLLVFLLGAQENLLNAQKNPTDAKISSSDSILTQSGVTIQWSEETCEIEMEGINYQHFVLKVHNQNQYPVTVEWDEALRYNTKCYNCEAQKSPEFHKTITLPANGTLSGSCQYPKDNTLTIFKQFNQDFNQAELLGFELQNLIVNQTTNY